MSAHPLFTAGGSSGPVYLRGRYFCKIGGIELPGIVTVSGFDLAQRVDPKDKAGGHGGNPTLRGLQAQQGSIRIVTWTDEQEQAVRDAIAALFPWPGTTRTEALSFDSWATDELVIVNAVILSGVSVRETVSDPPRATARTLKVWQWLPGVRGAKASAVKTPTRASRNARAEDAAARATAQNTAPSSRTGAAGP